MRSLFWFNYINKTRGTSTVYTPPSRGELFPPTLCILMPVPAHASLNQTTFPWLDILTHNIQRLVHSNSSLLGSQICQPSVPPLRVSGTQQGRTMPKGFHYSISYVHPIPLLTGSSLISRRYTQVTHGGQNRSKTRLITPLG